MGLPSRSCARRFGESEHGIEACVEAGLLVHDGHTLSFRHELARQVVDTAITPTRRARLHHAILGGLLDEGGVDPAVCAHHAELAGDPAAVLEYAPRAARRAAVLGAHREAVAQYERALRFAGGIAPAERATLLDEYTAELLVVNRSADALEASTDAVASWRAAGDRQGLAMALCRRARVLERVPDPDAALAAVRSAFALLEGSGDTPALACAHATLVWLYQMREERQQCVDAARVGFEVAERVGDEEATLEIMMSLGATELCLEEMGGWTRLDDAPAARSRGWPRRGRQHGACRRMVAYRSGEQGPAGRAAARARRARGRDRASVSSRGSGSSASSPPTPSSTPAVSTKRSKRRSRSRRKDRSFRPVPRCNHSPCSLVRPRGAGSRGARDGRRPRREGQALRRPVALHAREPVVGGGRFLLSATSSSERRGHVWVSTTWATRATSTGAVSWRCSCGDVKGRAMSTSGSATPIAGTWTASSPRRPSTGQSVGARTRKPTSSATATTKQDLRRAFEILDGLGARPRQLMVLAEAARPRCEEPSAFRRGRRRRRTRWG